MIKVDIYEYKRGSGSEILESKYFKKIAEAEKFVEKFNSRNNLPAVPDHYQVAKLS